MGGERKKEKKRKVEPWSFSLSIHFIVKLFVGTITGAIGDIISPCGSKDILVLQTWWEVPSSNKGKMERKEKASSVHVVHFYNFCCPSALFKIVILH